MLITRWAPLDLWPEGPAQLGVTMDASLTAHPVRFVLPHREVVAKAEGGAFRVDGQRVVVREPDHGTGGEPPTNAQVAAAHACVNAFLDAAFGGGDPSPFCATWYRPDALARDLRAIGKHGVPEARPRKLDGYVHPRFQRVLVSNSEFGPKGVTAFVTVAPLDGGWKVLTSFFSPYTPQPPQDPMDAIPTE